MPPKRLVTSIDSSSTIGRRRESAARLAAAGTRALPSAPSPSLLAGRGAPSRNTERRMSGRSSSSAVGPVEADLALLHEHGPLGQLSATFTDCSTRTIVVPLRVDRRARSRAAGSTIVGRQAERQLVDHQQLGLGEERLRQREHLLLAARQVAGQLVPSARAGPGSSSSTSLGGRRSTSRAVVADTASRRARRFSATVSVGNTPRPPGTCDDAEPAQWHRRRRG